MRINLICGEQEYYFQVAVCEVIFILCGIYGYYFQVSVCEQLSLSCVVNRNYIIKYPCVNSYFHPV